MARSKSIVAVSSTPAQNGPVAHVSVDLGVLPVIPGLATWTGLWTPDEGRDRTPRNLFHVKVEYTARGLARFGVKRLGATWWARILQPEVLRAAADYVRAEYHKAAATYVVAESKADVKRTVGTALDAATPEQLAAVMAALNGVRVKA